MKTLTEFSIVVLRRAAAARTARAGEGLEGEALTAAIVADLSLPEERVQRLLEALEVVGDRLEKVRLVRVFQGEKGPPGSTAKGEFHYAIDQVVAPGGKRRDDKRGGDRDRGGDRGRGGGDRGGGGGGGGGAAFGAPRKEKPKGLGSLMAAASGVRSDDRDDRVRPGEVPKAGIGWQLTAAPRDAREAGGRGKGPRRPDDRGGPGRDDRGRGRPGGGRPGGGGPGGGGPGGGGPGGPRRDDRGGPRADGPRVDYLRSEGGGGPRPESAGGPRPEGAGGPRPEGAEARPEGAGGPRPDDRGPRPPRPDRGPRPPRRDSRDARGPGGPGGPRGPGGPGGGGSGGGGRAPAGPAPAGVNGPGGASVQAEQSTAPVESVSAPTDQTPSE